MGVRLRDLADFAEGQAEAPGGDGREGLDAAEADGLAGDQRNPAVGGLGLDEILLDELGLAGAGCFLELNRVDSQRIAVFDDLRDATLESDGLAVALVAGDAPQGLAELLEAQDVGEGVTGLEGGGRGGRGPSRG